MNYLPYLLTYPTFLEQVQQQPGLSEQDIQSSGQRKPNAWKPNAFKYFIRKVADLCNITSLVSWDT